MKVGLKSYKKLIKLVINTYNKLIEMKLYNEKHRNKACNKILRKISTELVNFI